jgi:hypothetical protein
MTSADFAQEGQVSAYGTARRAAWLAHHAANAAMADRAAVEAHGQSEDHRVVQAGQGGLYQHMTPQQLGQAAAERPATVGGEWGLGRPLERNGHLSSSIGPAPARVDLTRVNDRPGFMQGQEPGVSPLLAHMRGDR